MLERPCPECGFDTRAFPVQEVATLVRENALVFRRLLDEGVIGSARPAATTWSPLEYACHVRDVYRRYRERIDLMLSQDDPLYPNWDQDATAVDDRYGEQAAPAAVEELAAAAATVAAQLDGVSGADWQRPGRRSDGASFTVETLARYMIHDPVHHVWDITHTPR